MLIHSVIKPKVDNTYKEVKTLYLTKEPLLFV